MDPDAGEPAAKKRPAAVLHLKRPAAVGAGVPAMMAVGTAAARPPPYQYKDCKNSVSWPKRAFRVFLDLSQANPSDVAVRWDHHPSRQAAWEEAIRMIRDK